MKVRTGVYIRSAAVSAFVVAALGAFASPAHAAVPRAAAGCYAAITSVISSLPAGATYSGPGVTATFDLGAAGAKTVTVSGDSSGVLPVTGLDGTVSGSACQGNGTWDATSTGGNINYDNASGPFTCSLIKARFAASVDANVDVPALTYGGDPFVDPTTLTPGHDYFEGLLKCASTLVPISAIDTFVAGAGGGATATPELGSGELLATGLVPVLGIWFLRRRRPRVGRQ